MQKPGVRPRRVTTYEKGKFPDTNMLFTSISCNHCDDPACTKVCPTGAMHKAPDGTVQHDDSKCIGCKSCKIACPYDAPQYSEEDRIIHKCDSCRPLREDGHNPVCVDTCPMRALDFGETTELEKKYGSDLVRDLPVLPNSDLTKPNIRIKARESAKSGAYHEVQV